MRKKSLGLALIFLLFCTYAFGEETITVVTYYPSPYGSYDEMRTNKMVIGDVNASTTPSPSQGAITFAPVSVPTTFSEGTLYYDNSAHNFKYRNNSGWSTMGGGISYTYYCFTNFAATGPNNHGSPGCTNAGGAQGYCPPGYTQKLALGFWGFCHNTDYGHYYFFPPGGGCVNYGSGSNIPYGVGSAYVCSQ